MMSVAATFDVLYLTQKITAVTSSRTGDPQPGAADLEVHCLAYFANMLHQWTAEEQPWGYEFYTTKDSEPFATALDGALRTLKARGLILDLGMLNTVTDAGERLLSDISERFEPRSAVLDVALSTARFLSIPLVVRGIGNDPTLRASKVSRPLLDESAVAVLSEYLDAAQSLMGESFNLAGLAEVVLSYFLVMEAGAAT